MKMYFRTLTLLCTAGALFAACSNETEPVAQNGAVQVTAIATTAGENTRVILTEDNDAHKLRVSWKESGETFKVFTGDNYEGNTFTQTGANSADNKQATFTGSLTVNSGDQCLALYSGNPNHFWGKHDNSYEFYIGTQSGTQYNAESVHMYAYATYKDVATPLKFEFKQLTTTLKATIQFPAGVTGTATDVSLTTDNAFRIYGQINFTNGEPVYEDIVMPTKSISFVDSEGKSTNFPIEDRKITVYANLFPVQVKNLRLVATVNGKPYTAMLMEDKHLEAGKWYYPTGGAKEATVLEGFTVDAATHTLHFTHPGDLSLYDYAYVMELLTPVIDATSGLLTITGTPSDADLQCVGVAAFGLAQYGGTTLKILDLTALTSLTALPSNMMFNVTSLTEVKLPESVTVIKGNAFRGCTNLTTINLEKIVSIGGNAFDSCKSIGTYELPTLTELGSSAFKRAEFQNLNAPLLETLNDVFSDGVISGTINLPNCKEIADWQSFINSETDQDLTLKLTRAGEIELVDDAFTWTDYDGTVYDAAAKINLVLNPDKQSEVSGTTWKGYTFKSITFEDPNKAESSFAGVQLKDFDGEGY